MIGAQPAAANSVMTGARQRAVCLMFICASHLTHVRQPAVKGLVLVNPRMLGN